VGHKDRNILPRFRIQRLQWLTLLTLTQWQSQKIVVVGAKLKDDKENLKQQPMLRRSLKEEEDKKKKKKGSKVCKENFPRVHDNLNTVPIYVCLCLYI
jgi:hypothetical protein